MLNEERIILMTKMAAYEAKEGKKNMSIGKYFRSDYIAIQVIKAVISATIAFAVGFALFIFYDFEVFMQDIYKIDLLVFARNVLIYYAVAVVGYGGIVYVICSYGYAKAKKSLKRYSHNLKKLSSLYDE